MLKIEKLTKRYRCKGAEDVLALNNVSIEFPTSGMVFILGKSGSGKSTLLNLVGGLEEPTSGEIIVDGKSTSSFTREDYDFYRNTYVGFIFQEYNLIHDIDVMKNISLALEIQGKKVTKEEVKEVLKLVDLEDVEDRLPDALSGGQKQRVAIARALIKKPEVILADEPSGALDSETGEQVFTTLKKLSKTRLVVVVSHDEDFANRYADRIIKLKDGEVLSDEIINETEQIEQAPRELIESNLPTKLAIKMGLHNVKMKPIRLAVTIILSVVAYSMLGILSTLMFYDASYSYTEAIKDEAYRAVRLEKTYNYNEKTYRYNEQTNNYDFLSEAERSHSTNISKEEIQKLNKNKVGLKFAGVYSNPNRYFSYEDCLYTKLESKYYNNYAAFSGLCDCGEDFLKRQGFKKVAGEYPQKENEIAITTYAVDLFKKCEYKEANSTKRKIESAEDLIGLPLSFDIYNVYDTRTTAVMYITGVYDVGIEYLNDEFYRLRHPEFAEEGINIIDESDFDFNDAFNTCYFSLGFVSEGFYDTYKGYLLSNDVEKLRITPTYLQGMNIISPYEYTTLKYYRNDPSYNTDAFYPTSQDVRLDNGLISDIRNYEDSIIFLDFEGNKIENPLNLKTQEFYLNAYSYTFSDLVEDISRYVIRYDLAYYDRNGKSYHISDYFNNVSYPSLYINYNDLSISFEVKDGYEHLKKAIFDDEGNLMYYQRNIYYNMDLSDYAFEEDVSYYREAECWFKKDGTKVGDIKTKNLTNYFYDLNDEKMYTIDDVEYIESENEYVLKENPNKVLAETSSYYLDAQGNPKYPQMGKDNKVGLFVDKNNGEISFTKKNDNSVFCDEYYLDDDGNIIIGKMVTNGFVFNIDGETVKSLTDTVAGFGFTNCHHIDENNIYYMLKNKDLTKSLIKYYNRTGYPSRLEEIILDDYFSFADKGYEITQNDFKNIMNAYYDIQNLKSTASGEEANISKVFGMTRVDKRDFDLNLKGFFIPTGYCECEFEYLLADEWKNLSPSYFQDYQRNDNWRVEKESNYVIDSTAQYNSVICNTKETRDQFVYMLKKNSDGTFYKFKNDTFDRVDRIAKDTVSLQADVFIIGAPMALLSAFLFMNFMSRSISSKKNDIGVLRALGAKRKDIFKIFFFESLILLLSSMILSYIVSGVMTVIIDAKLASKISTSIFFFRFLDVGFISGVALLAWLIGVTAPLIKVTRKAPNELIRSL